MLAAACELTALPGDHQLTYEAGIAPEDDGTRRAAKISALLGSTDKDRATLIANVIGIGAKARAWLLSSLRGVGGRH